MLGIEFLLFGIESFAQLDTRGSGNLEKSFLKLSDLSGLEEFEKLDTDLRSLRSLTL